MSALRRAWTAFRRDAVRAVPFDRKPRVRPGPLPSLTPEQQVAYDRACRYLQQMTIVTGKEGR